MARQARRKTQPLIDTLLFSGDHFDLNQLFRIIQQSLKPKADPIFRPANSLAFPASAVTANYLTQERPVIELNCLGLYGVSSPLPHYFITDALDEENTPLRCFLGIFNQIIYLAYFNAWKQKNPHLFYDTALRGHSIICAIAMLDLDPTEPLAKIATHFLYEQRHFYGLKALLTSLYSGIPIQVNLHDCDWVKNSKQLPMRLGDNITLGPRIASHAKRISITLGPVCEKRARQLSPYHPMGKSLLFWVHHYLNHGYAIDFSIILDHEQKSCNTMRSMSLGWNAFLNSRKTSQVAHVCKFR